MPVRLAVTLDQHLVHPFEFGKVSQDIRFGFSDLNVGTQSFQCPGRQGKIVFQTQFKYGRQTDVSIQVAV
jgi:hypothetical protein